MIAGGYSAVVFDLDGTLADTAADIREAVVRALAAEGLPPVDVASVRLMDRLRLARYFYYPPLVVLCLLVIYTVLIGTFIIGS